MRAAVGIGRASGTMGARSASTAQAVVPSQMKHHAISSGSVWPIIRCVTPTKTNSVGGHFTMMDSNCVVAKNRRNYDLESQ